MILIFEEISAITFVRWKQIKRYNSVLYVLCVTYLFASNYYYHSVFFSFSRSFSFPPALIFLFSVNILTHIVPVFYDFEKRFELCVDVLWPWIYHQHTFRTFFFGSFSCFFSKNKEFFFSFSVNQVRTLRYVRLFSWNLYKNIYSLTTLAGYELRNSLGST